MNAPQSAYAKQLERLAFYEPVQELELRRIIQQGKLDLPKVSSAIATEVHAVLANALFKLNKFEEASEHYRIACKLRPDLASFHCCLGASLLALGRAKDALPHLLDALDREAAPRDRVVVLANLAEAFLWVGDAEGAAEAFADAKDLAQPDDLQAALCLATTAAELGASAEALSFFWRFVTLRRGLTEPIAVRTELQDDERAILRQLPAQSLRLLLAKDRAFASVVGDLRGKAKPIEPDRRGGGRAVLNEFSELRARAAKRLGERRGRST